MKRFLMIWWILTKKDVSVYWKKDCLGGYAAGYETTATDNKAANMACNMCMWAKSRKYGKEQIPSRSCNHFEE